MEEINWKEWHGWGGDKSWDLPILVAASTEAGRADQGNDILANEYIDTPETAKKKASLLAQLVLKSKHMTAYCGAGLSSSSGIPDYATKATNSVVQKPQLDDMIYAQPTYAHQVLCSLERSGHLKVIVQQNHDGLPQKCGFPQNKINEIHGAWYDPTNPVVQFGQNLRSDLFEWLLQIEKETDLCLCLGTSLSGMNADRVVSTTAARAKKKKKGDDTTEGEALGMIIATLQRTPMDAQARLRFWGKLDDVFELLAEALHEQAGNNFLDPICVRPAKVPAENGDLFLVPYNEKGDLDHDNPSYLDLRHPSQIQVVSPNAVNHGCTGYVVGKAEEHYKVTLQLPGGSITVSLLGNWWIADAIDGKLPQLPFVNTERHRANMKIEKEPEEEEKKEEKGGGDDGNRGREEKGESNNCVVS